MNQKALDNQEYVRRMLFVKQPELFFSLARVTAELMPVVGFGSCETDVPPSSSLEEDVS